MLNIEAVNFHYGETHEQCLHDVSLHVKAGECVLLCGESGCGKTTVTRLVNGLIPHFYEGEFSGKVVVSGLDVTKTMPDVLAGTVGSVFQNPRSQFFSLDTTGEIAFGCENLGLSPAEIRERVKKTSAELGIERLLDRDIFALSGGEKQLIAIAAAYALSPEVFVFDEPSSNLDWNAVGELAHLMLRLKQAGRTLIVAEHRLYWLAGPIDRVVYLRGGRIAGDWQAAAFLALPERERAELGLRALNPEALRPSASMVVWEQAPMQEQAPTQGRTAPNLRVSDLSAWYKRGEPVLRGISFEARPGESVAILGGNGAGKTTLARTLCGLNRKAVGKITLNGSKLSPKARAGPFYLVMQESGYQLFTDSVENELLLSKNRRSRPTSEKVGEILESLSLTDFRERHPMSLSGGQRQRTAIGTAMAHEAEVLIFDEPTSGLDYQNMRRVVAVIEQLRAEGKAVFIITHDYELLLAACTRALVLEDGRLKADFPLTKDSIGRIKEIFSWTQASSK
ncbi:MAG: energy-coupling factor ABC transporter ATP-binding protein [Coriobacteriales bacterium]|jgi:energy-coupling factor transport system ATP-binding protein|nr:energy-coupling factor ABC transporter ATP-binding protein [Coriobacteriales bacterium]